MCYSLWYNAHTMLRAGHLPATSLVHYTTSCNTQSSATEDGRDQRPKHVELIGIINKPLLLHLVGVYIIYEQCNAARYSHHSQQTKQLLGTDYSNVKLSCNGMFISKFDDFCENLKRSFSTLSSLLR